MRAHQPGSTPIDIPETVPNPAYTPAPAPAPERAPTKVPEKVPEKVIAPESSGAFFFPPVASEYYIRAYRWCSPPRIGCATMSPNRSIGRVHEGSLLR